MWYLRQMHQSARVWLLVEHPFPSSGARRQSCACCVHTQHIRFLEGPRLKYCTSLNLMSHEARTDCRGTSTVRYNVVYLPLTLRFRFRRTVLYSTVSNAMFKARTHYCTLQTADKQMQSHRCCTVAATAWHACHDYSLRTLL